MAKTRAASSGSRSTSSPVSGSALSAAPNLNRPVASPAAADPRPAVAKVAPTHDQIAKRAYEIWISKGRPAGRDAENWQQAERELRGR